MITYKIIENNNEYQITAWVDGHVEYYNFKGQFNDRKNGPAIYKITPKLTYKTWYKNGHMHNESGAARIFHDGGKEYWHNGKCYPDIISDDEWTILQIIE